MADEISLDSMPKEALVVLVKEKLVKEKEQELALKNALSDKEALQKNLEESQKALEKTFVGGTVTEKIKDIPTICQIAKMDSYYATFLEQMLPKDPDYFVNAINGRLQALIEKEKISLKDSQVDENGEALITTLEGMDNSLFSVYVDASMVDDKFAKTYTEQRAEFYRFKRMVHTWQHFMVELFNLMLAAQHTFLHAQKAKNPNTKLVIDTSEGEENKKMQELETKIAEQNALLKKLEARLNQTEREKSEVRAEEMKTQDLDMLEEAKEEAGPNEDLPSVPDEPEERSRRRRREE